MDIYDCPRRITLDDELAEARYRVENNLVDVHYDMIVLKENGYKMFEEDHHMRYFFKPEIELMLSISGFELIECLDCTTFKETDFSSWTAYFVAKAI